MFELKLSNKQYQIEPKVNPNRWLNKPQMDFSKPVKETVRGCSKYLITFYNLENSLKSRPKMQGMAFPRRHFEKASAGPDFHSHATQLHLMA